MHVAPVVIVPHRLGPDGWMQSLQELSATLDRHPHLPLTLRVPGAALEHLDRQDPELWEALADSDILWLAGGYSDPVLTDLPDGGRLLQLRRERAVMDLVGVDPGGLWVADAWEPALVTLATEVDLGLVFIDDSLIPQAPIRPGATERAGSTVLALAVGEHLENTDDDGLVAVRLDVAGLESFIAEHRGSLIRPDDYLGSHLPGPRLTPRAGSPGRPGDAEPFYRKLLLLAEDQGERSSGQDALLRLQSREHAYGPPGEVDTPDVALLDARAALDALRHRGDSWVTVRSVDWDADGIDEVQVETASVSLLVDPVEGTLDAWEDKTISWPITSVRPALAGVIARRLTPDGEEPAPAPSILESQAHGRGEATIVLTGEDGTCCRLEVSGSSLSIELTLPDEPPARVGPELPVMIAGGRLRVDGGEWRSTSEPVAVSGHRYRLADDRHSLVISSIRPCELFVRPLPVRGLMVWPHWVTSGGASYRATFTSSAT